MDRPTVTEIVARDYRIVGSRAFAAEYDQVIEAFDTRTFSVSYAADAPVTVLELRRAADAPLDLQQVPPGGHMVGDLQILVSIAPPDAGMVRLTCNVINNGGSQVTDRWRLRAGRATAAAWRLTFGDLTASTTVRFVASDPRAELTAPASTKSGVPIPLTATDATGTGAERTIVGTLPADLAPRYSWSQVTGAVALPGLPDCTVASTLTVTAPAVAAPGTAEVAVHTSFGGTCPANTAFLESTSAPAPLTIVPAEVVPPVPLSIATASAPAIHRVWDLEGSITGSDSTADFVLQGTTGSAFLQSRTFPVGETGTPAVGLFGIEWRVHMFDLKQAAANPRVTELRIDIGPIVPLDYNLDGVNEHVFVITAGGLGDVGLASVTQAGNAVVFRFAGAGVAVGSAAARGQSSFFFGVTSPFAAHPVTATLVDSAGVQYSLAARAPAHP
jgi:hypothetical protein